MARSDRRISKRYARALLQALLPEAQAALRAALPEFAACWQEQAELRQALQNPASATVVRMEIIKELARRICPGQQQFENLLALLLLNGRLAHVPQLAADFEELCLRQEQILPVQIIAAHDLAAEEREAVVRDLEQELQRKVAAAWQVDPAIIGGLVIQAGDRLLDRSVQGMLAQVSKELLA